MIPYNKSGGKLRNSNIYLINQQTGGVYLSRRQMGAGLQNHSFLTTVQVPTDRSGLVSPRLFPSAQPNTFAFSFECFN